MATDPTEEILKSLDEFTKRVNSEAATTALDSYFGIVKTINQLLAMYQLAGPEKYPPGEVLSQIAQLTALLEPMEGAVRKLIEDREFGTGENFAADDA